MNRLHAKSIVVGKDFHFGYKRGGDATLLLWLQKKYGFQVEVVEKEQYKGRDISSTYVKEALEAGDMELVNDLLGYRYFISGEVLHGRRIGRTLGMPTTIWYRAPKNCFRQTVSIFPGHASVNRHITV